MRPFSEKPTEWAEWVNGQIVDAGSDVFYMIVGEGIAQGGKANNVWVFHWHTPDACRHCLKPGDPDGDHSCTCPLPDGECTEHTSLDRWQLSACDLHTVVTVEPLTLDPSLGCENGCPSHGWIRQGRWTPA